MSTNDPLQKALLQLDKSSPDSFADQLRDILRRRDFDEQISSLQTTADLMEVIDYLDKALDKLDPAGATFRQALRKLQGICTSRMRIPTSHILPSGLLQVNKGHIASGGFSDVFRGTFRGIGVCVKRLRVAATSSPEKVLYREAVIWKRLKHDNVVPIIGVTFSPLQIVSEWMSGGDLTAHVKSNPRTGRIALLVDVAEGLNYLHECDVVHGGLKGANIVVGADGRARITDPGLSRDQGAVEETGSTSGGTARWTAPEILQGRSVPNKRADVFSFAMVMFEGFTGTSPFDLHLSITVALDIMRGDRPERPTHAEFTDGLWGLMQYCWSQEPRSRPKMSEVLDILHGRRPTSRQRKLAGPPRPHPNHRTGNFRASGQRSISMVWPPNPAAMKQPHGHPERVPRVGWTIEMGNEMPVVNSPPRDLGGNGEGMHQPGTRRNDSGPSRPDTRTESRSRYQSVTHEGPPEQREPPREPRERTVSSIPRTNGGGGSIRERGPQDVSAVPLDTPDPPVKKGRLFLGLGRRGGVTRQSVSLVSSLDPPALRRSRRLNRPLSELYNQFNGSRVDTPAGIQVTQKFPPIILEDLAKFGVESQLIPFIISVILQVERSPSGSLPLYPAKSEGLVESLDKVVSSATVNPSLKNRCFRALRKVSPAYGVLPKSYFPPNVALSDTVPHSVEGGSADVWKGKQGGNHVCIKGFRTQTTANLEKLKPRFYREIVAWKYVLHPNVVPFLGVSEVLFSFSIITPWLPNGNIADYVQKHEGVDRLQLLAQATRGLEYLHSLGIIHGNVTPENILITEEGDARLGDFGIRGIITDSTVAERGGVTDFESGVTRYLAPELLNPQFGLPDSNPSKESDVYSFAMTAYEVLSGAFSYDTWPESAFSLDAGPENHPPRPSNPTADRWLSDAIWDIIECCWDRDPRLRLPIGLLRRAFVGPDLEQEEDTTVAGGRGETIHPFDIKDALPDPEETLGQEGAQGLIDTMDEGSATLRSHVGPDKERLILFNKLCKTCSRKRLLPRSMYIPDRSWESVGDDCYGGQSTVSPYMYEGGRVAVKVPYLYLTSDFDRILSRFCREVVAWRHLQHPNILPLLGVSLAERRFAMVSEWMEHGNINGFVQKNPGVNRIELLVGVAEGLAYMHGLHVVHGDLKGANILINKDLRACISDFGLTTVTRVRIRVPAAESLFSLLSGDTVMSFTPGGTARWMSPEILDPVRFGIPEPEGDRPTRESDCYALGMVIYEVLCGHAPYHDISGNERVILAITEGIRPKEPENATHLGFTELLWGAVERCWLEDWRARPCVEDILACLNGVPPSWQKGRRLAVRRAITLFWDSR